MSYTIFKKAARKKGRSIMVLVDDKNSGRSGGANDTPIVLAELVTPFTAERSADGTTVATYACLAGTSIWLIENRANSIPTAVASDGMRGTSNSKTFEGRCV